MCSGLEVIKLELILRLKIKRNACLLADTLTACGHESACSQSLCLSLSLRLYSSSITSRSAFSHDTSVVCCFYFRPLLC